MTHKHHSGFDTHMMDVALAMGRRGLGTTSPNPSVGALVVDEVSGQIIARGWTQPGGRPHGETQALTQAGPNAQGKTLYVTLEPCSHHGQTPPCVDAILAAGISRVVVARTDPDPRVAGRGLARLKEAGLQVTCGVRSQKALDLSLGHILRVTERRPFVQLKMALGPDGQVPHGDGKKPTWVTGPLARSFGHMLRANTDAILIGSGTLKDDNPQLTCRLPGLQHRSPIRIVLCDPIMISKDTRLLLSNNQSVAGLQEVWVVSGNTSSMAQNQANNLGFQIIQVTTVNDKIWLPALAETLVERGVTRLLVEGGPTLWRAFAKAGLVDEVVVFIAGKKLNRSSGSPRHKNLAEKQVSALVEEKLPNLKLDLKDKRSLGDDYMFKYQAN